MPKDACFFTPPLQSHQIKHSSTNSSRDKYMLCTVCCYITGVYTCVLRYMFEYGRDGWKKSIKMIFPRDTPRAWAVKGDWAHSHSHGGVVLPPPYLLQAQSKPVGKGCCHPLPHLGTVFKQPVPVWSDRKKILFSLHCWPQELLLNKRHYSQILAGGGRGGWKPVDEDKLY